MCSKLSQEVSELFPFLLRANKMRLTDRKRRVNKVQAQGDRPNHMSIGFFQGVKFSYQRFYFQM